MIVDYISFILFLLLSARIDANLLNRGGFIYEHYTRATLRALFIYSISGNDLVLFLGYSLVFAGTFDNILNLMRGKELLHLGRTAWWDKFWRKRRNLYVLFIISSIASGIYLLIKNY